MLDSLLQVLRRIAGMPDYRAYVNHLHQRHPELPIPTEREYYEDFLRSRYAANSTRCC